MASLLGDGLQHPRDPGLATTVMEIRASPASSDGRVQTHSNTQEQQQQQQPYPDSEPAKSFICNVCKRSYSRADHLARHYRAHTREKPFTCQICGKGFSRRDLLKRHITNHSNGEGEGSRQLNHPLMSSRVAQACTACAAAKLKCGHDKPCKRCREKGITCTSSSDGRRRTETSLEGDQRQGDASSHNAVDDGDLRKISTTRIVISQNLYHSSEIQDSEVQERAAAPLVHPPTFPRPLPLDGIMPSFDDSSFANFIQGIVMPPAASTQMPTTAMPLDSTNVWPQLDSFRDVFNFGNNNSLSADDMNLDWLKASNNMEFIPGFDPFAFAAVSNMETGQRTPDVSPGLSLSAEAFQRSLWQFLPAQQDHGATEEDNLALPIRHTEAPDPRFSSYFSGCRFEQDSRDRIMAMLFKICTSPNFSRNVANFPSVSVLESLMQAHLRIQLFGTEPWIHVPTFQPASQIPELNGAIIAAGAVLSPFPTVRKLGYALQEVVRLAIWNKCEEDNRRSRNIQYLQAFALEKAIGLWSGNRRKIEIAESHTLILVTMLRRAGRFRRSRQRIVAPELTDDDETLEKKWRIWAEVESYKRLCLHNVIYDAQVSMALFVRPLISHTELSLELPCRQALWVAHDARAWRDVYLEDGPGVKGRLPSVANCVHDMTLLTSMKDEVDLQWSISIILYAMWGLASEYRQLESVVKIPSADHRFNGALISASWHQELSQLLDGFRDTVQELDGALSVDLTIVLELYRMNMYVSFEELQLFAGKGGYEEAERAYPMLKLWVESRKSRQAVWHASQIIRAAASCEPQRLRDFYAVALYHASLALWAYGVVCLGTSRTSWSPNNSMQHVPIDELVWLDSDDPAMARRFVNSNRGVPVIRHFPPENNEAGFPKYACLDHPEDIMDTTINILNRDAVGDSDVLPPLLGNLSQLIRDLGHAARVIIQQR